MTIQKQVRGEELLTIVHGKQQALLGAIIEIYGTDTNLILNALHEMAARIAISTDTPPEEFASGVKHHWDLLAAQINKMEGRA